MAADAADAAPSRAAPLQLHGNLPARSLERSPLGRARRARTRRRERSALTVGATRLDGAAVPPSPPLLLLATILLDVPPAARSGRLAAWPLRRRRRPRDAQRARTARVVALAAAAAAVDTGRDEAAPACDFESRAVAAAFGAIGR